jgi:hypothetical protein
VRTTRDARRDINRGVILRRLYPVLGMLLGFGLISELLYYFHRKNWCCAEAANGTVCKTVIFAGSSPASASLPEYLPNFLNWLRVTDDEGSNPFSGTIIKQPPSLTTGGLSSYPGYACVGITAYAMSSAISAAFTTFSK